MDGHCKKSNVGIPVIIALIALALAFSPWISKSRVYRRQTSYTRQPVKPVIDETETTKDVTSEDQKLREQVQPEERAVGERKLGQDPGPVQQKQDTSRQELQEKRENVLVRAGRAVVNTVSKATEAVVNYFKGKEQPTTERQTRRVYRRDSRGTRR